MANEIQMNELQKVYGSLIHTVLHQQNIFRNHWHFQDYEQELWTKLWLMTAGCETLATFREKYTRTYLCQKLEWFLLDLIRENWGDDEADDLEEHAESLGKETASYEALEVKQCLKKFKKQLTPIQIRHLNELLKDDQVHHLDRRDRERFRRGFQKCRDKWRSDFGEDHPKMEA